jgi:hypothetical protein
LFHIGRGAVLPVQLCFSQPAVPDAQIGIVVVAGSVRVALGVFQKAKEIFSGLLEGSFNLFGHRSSIRLFKTCLKNSAIFGLWGRLLNLLKLLFYMFYLRMAKRKFADAMQKIAY